ncbi:MAG: tRNA-intron lyase [Haloarculaceae archaeon]
MDATLTDGVVRAGSGARERFYDSRGYGRPVDGGALELAPVEAAHLLYRGDLDGVDGQSFRTFLASAAVSETAFLVYKDLRDRGFYLSPARDAWVADGVTPDGAVDFLVYPRGSGPWDGAVAYRVRVVGEREPVAAGALGDAVLAVVDEESEITYLETDRPGVEGTSGTDLPEGVAAELLEERAFVWNPPASLYERGFYGQRLGDRDGEVLQLSLLEAAYLADRGVLAVTGGAEAVRERGRDAEGDRFDRRLRAYTALRERGVVPKTGFKFGADFRTYAHVDSVADLGHSELLVRVLATDHAFAPRDLALDVRLAHGVRKEMVFALVGDEVEWLSVGRLTP